MADNLQFTSGAVADSKAATDEVSYSGETAHVQLLKLVQVAGSEGSRTVNDVAGTAGTPSTGVLTVQGVSSGTAVNVVQQPATSGGYSISHIVTAASANATSVKASAGQLYALTVYNNATYPIYVKFHNTAGTPTAGSGVIAAFGVQAGVTFHFPLAAGLPFATGIGVTVVKDIANGGTTAVAASDAIVDIFYK